MSYYVGYIASSLIGGVKHYLRKPPSETPCQSLTTKSKTSIVAVEALSAGDNLSTSSSKVVKSYTPSVTVTIKMQPGFAELSLFDLEQLPHTERLSFVVKHELNEPIEAINVHYFPFWERLERADAAILKKINLIEFVLAHRFGNLDVSKIRYALTSDAELLLTPISDLRFLTTFPSSHHRVQSLPQRFPNEIALIKSTQLQEKPIETWTLGEFMCAPSDLLKTNQEKIPKEAMRFISLEQLKGLVLETMTLDQLFFLLLALMENERWRLLSLDQLNQLITLSPYSIPEQDLLKILPLLSSETLRVKFDVFFNVHGRTDRFASLKQNQINDLLPCFQWWDWECFPECHISGLPFSDLTENQLTWLFPSSSDLSDSIRKKFKLIPANEFIKTLPRLSFYHWSYLSDSHIQSLKGNDLLYHKLEWIFPATSDNEEIIKAKSRFALLEPADLYKNRNLLSSYHKQLLTPAQCYYLDKGELDQF